MKSMIGIKKIKNGNLIKTILKSRFALLLIFWKKLKKDIDTVSIIIYTDVADMVSRIKNGEEIEK